MSKKAVASESAVGLSSTCACAVSTSEGADRLYTRPKKIGQRKNKEGERHEKNRCRVALLSLTLAGPLMLSLQLGRYRQHTDAGESFRRWLAQRTFPERGGRKGQDDKIDELLVDLTIVGGKTVYERAQSK
jgi:hypothetical protein